jgi:lipid II:glycine glycyltransferase (peptidoglycan interpeptide bridge formation enzyme)
MKIDQLETREKLAERVLDVGEVTAWISRTEVDSCWDAYLQGTPLGQYQQSAMWARSKHMDGWLPVRVLMTVRGEIVGGFQILQRSSWWGKYGYVSKGPVITSISSELAKFTSELIQKVCRIERTRALVVQPPDECKQMGHRLDADGFSLDVLQYISDATWLINISGDFAAVEQGMRKETRQKVRQATNRGLTVREGGREDVRTFFELMLSTCRRQGVDPSPPTLDHMYAIWDAAKPAGCIRISFSEFEGKPLTGLLCIMFGKTATVWKRGWSEFEANRHPNDLMQYEVLKWANGEGYQFADFSNLDKEMAFAFLSGKPLPSGHSKTRHLFNIRFGGEARMLPEARIYFANPVARRIFRIVFSKKLKKAEEICRLSAQIRGESR